MNSNFGTFLGRNDEKLHQKCHLKKINVWIIIMDICFLKSAKKDSYTCVNEITIPKFLKVCIFETIENWGNRGNISKLNIEHLWTEKGKWAFLYTMAFVFRLKTGKPLFVRTYGFLRKWFYLITVFQTKIVTMDLITTK